MFRKMRFAALLSVLLIAASCGNNGGNGGGHNPGTPTDKVDAFVEVLISDTAVIDVEVLKNLEDTRSEGWIVIRPTVREDEGLGAYRPPEDIGFAVNLNNFEVGDSWDDFLVKSVETSTNGSYGYGGYGSFWLYDNDVSLAENGDFYGSVWNSDIGSSVSMTFSEEKGKAKDLEKVGAVKEAYATKKVKDLLNFDYGLSEKRSESVAKLVVNWSKVSNNRAMTSADADAFTEKLIGVNINEATEAYKASLEGDETSLDSLIEKAAEVNETSPENMKELFNNLVLNK